MYTTLKICYWFLKFLEESYVKYLLNNEKIEGIFGFFVCVREATTHGYTKVLEYLKIQLHETNWLLIWFKKKKKQRGFNPFKYRFCCSLEPHFLLHWN